MNEQLKDYFFNESPGLIVPAMLILPQMASYGLMVRAMREDSFEQKVRDYAIEFTLQRSKKKQESKCCGQVEIDLDRNYGLGLYDRC
ncbi:hypothetical protein ACFL1H_03110 [Nanoarchaeota archaeon]